MAAKTYISFRTAGGSAVHLRYQPMTEDPPDGVYADCGGCRTARGPGGEHATRQWALSHAAKCAKRHA
jgi:hypothetical protein